MPGWNANKTEMTVCAPCRVRHLKCDAKARCAECEKAGRECVRMNVRFRHLVCPPGKVTQAAYGKYEFFFDSQQTWLDTYETIHFGAENVIDDDSSAINKIDDASSEDISVIARSMPAVTGPAYSTSTIGSTHSPSTEEATITREDLPGNSEDLNIMHYDSQRRLLDGASTEPMQSLGEASYPTEKFTSDASISSPTIISSNSQATYSLQSLEECKLLQHFVTHLGPWVSTEALTTRILTHS